MGFVKRLPVLALAKQAVDTGFDMDLDRACDLQAEFFALCFDT